MQGADVCTKRRSYRVVRAQGMATGLKTWLHLTNEPPWADAVPEGGAGTGPPTFLACPDTSRVPRAANSWPAARPSDSRRTRTPWLDSLNSLPRGEGGDAQPTGSSVRLDSRLNCGRRGSQ